MLGLADDLALTEHLINEAMWPWCRAAPLVPPGTLRLSFACSMEELQEAVARIKRAVSA